MAPVIQNMATPCSSISSLELLAGIQKRNIERALADAQLPLWNDAMRGVPNGVLRSALFGAIKRGKRRYMERESIACIKGVSIIYTGPRLDQSDLDVWEGALHLARLDKLGNLVEFTEKAFLRLIGRGGSDGRNIGKSDREWLRKAIARLTATAVEISQGPYTYCGSLIDEYYRNSASGRHVVILNPSMRVIFNRDGWTQVDWSIRRALIGYPLAQWLHGFYSTHAAPLPYKVETLHILCGSESGLQAKKDSAYQKALYGWKEDSLIPALNTLKSISDHAGQQFSWEIGSDELVQVKRTPSIAQGKHLRTRITQPKQKVGFRC